MVGNRGFKNSVEATLDEPERQQRDNDGTTDEQNSLNHLHISRALHAADQNVDDHEYTDDGDNTGLRGFAGDAQQQGNQAARTGHLRDQVKQGDHQRGHRGGCAHRSLLEAE